VAKVARNVVADLVLCVKGVRRNYSHLSNRRVYLLSMQGKYGNNVLLLYYNIITVFNAGYTHTERNRYIDRKIVKHACMLNR
jgi:hypothetical protein